jgi:hypothetical protein
VADVWLVADCSAAVLDDTVRTALGRSGQVDREQRRDGIRSSAHWVVLPRRDAEKVSVVLDERRIRYDFQ